MGVGLHVTLFLASWQSDGERGAGGSAGGVGVGFDENIAAVHLDDPVGYGQAESGAFAGLFGREEGLENLLEMFFGNSGSRVAHANTHAGLIARTADHDAAGGRCGGQCVVDQDS